jgi:hypothetical protein
LILPVIWVSIVSMNTNKLANLTVRQLKQAVSIRERIESLERKLGRILTVHDGAVGNDRPKGGKRGMSAAGRARVAAAMKARWRKAKQAGRSSL